MIKRTHLALIALLVLAAPAAHATWVVILTDAETGEVGIGQATCVSGLDLRAVSAVIVTGKGVATVQAFVDTSGVSRTTIRDELLAGTPPAQILNMLSTGDPDYEGHQYCIVDVDHGAATYTGTTAQTFNFAGGLTGQAGNIRYCVAGNVITGQPVLDQAELAIANTAGSLSDKLMAAMEAARSMGGDGRCSCSPADPTGCGSPPASFTVSAINGYLVGARAGDTSDCAFCSGGDYYMDLNVAFRPQGSPDPVTQLQTLYDNFVTGQQGLADAVVSPVTLAPDSLLPDGSSTSQMDVQLLDIDGAPITASISSFDVQQSADSDAVTSIGTPVDNGGGSYSTTLTAGVVAGVDLFLVTADDGVRPVILMPNPRLPVGVPGEVQNLRWSDHATLEWDAATGAVSYHVYRGDLNLLGCSFLGDCRDDLDVDPTDLMLNDSSEPLPGAAFFYLLSGVDAAGTEGTLGLSDCGLRAASSPCP